MVVRVAKRKSWEEFGRSLQNDYKENNRIFWKKIRAMRGRTCKPVRNVKDERGNLLTKKEEILARWQRHFKSIFSIGSEEQLEGNQRSGAVEYDDIIWEEEVEWAMNKISLGKAAGRDGIAPELIKFGGPELQKALQSLFQKVLSEKTMPKDWRENVIIPIHKKGSSTDCNNYRPICLSQVVYKIYTSILERKLRAIVEHDLEEEQAAFRPQRQTQDHIFSLRTIIEKSWERGKSLYLAFLDIRAAFDSVPWKEIWKALAAKNVPIKLIDAIKSTYMDAKGIIRINGQESEPFEIKNGMKQGDSLSPLLFIIFMDEIIKMCKRRTPRTIIGKWNMRAILAQALVFADDIVLIADSSANLQQAVMEWEAELERRGMKINVNKSKVMQVGREEEDVEIHCKGERLETADEYTYLGTVISRNAKIDHELSNRIKKANSLYYHLCNTVAGKREIGNGVKLHVFKAVYLPTLLYGSESWVPLDKHWSRVTAVEMKYLRRVAGRTRRDQVRNERIREELGVTAVRDTVQKRQLKWFGHLCRMNDDRDPRKFLEARPTGKRPRGRPRLTWIDHISRLGQNRGRQLNAMKVLARDRDAWLAWIEAPLR